MLFIGAKDAITRKKIAKGKELLEKMDEFAEMYVNDEKTKELYGKWGEYIALEKGKKLGKKEGIEQNKVKIAKSMLKDKLSIKAISKYTGLSKEEINNIILD